MLFDSHCHLTFPDFKGRMADIQSAMHASSVAGAIVIDTTLEEFDEVHALAMAHENLWATVGVHPDNENVLEPTVNDLLTRAALPKVVAIGETGLDYYRLKGRSVADMQWQRDRFRVHVQAAMACDKPLVIHTRSASNDTLQILRDCAGASATSAAKPKGVFHCFTETQAVADAALDMGFYVSFSGIVTFKNAVELQAVAQRVPLDRLLIETDSPYLAPVPHRGKTNQPAYVAHVAEFVSRLRGISVEELAAATTGNVCRLFGMEFGRQEQALQP